VSIDQPSLSMAGADAGMYEQGIREGAIVWALATHAAIGAVEVGMNLQQAHITVRLQEEDALRGRHGVTNPRVSGRVLQPGTEIVLFTHGIATRVGLLHTPEAGYQVRPIVAKVMAHEMGHALGILGHSSDPTDVMFAQEWASDAPPYPWVTERDWHTLAEAYCR
jgi:predicted Zn-dependent protease